MVLAPFNKTLNQTILRGFILVAGVVILFLSVPRFLHELMLVPGTPIKELLNSGKSVTDEELALFEKSRFDALSFIELPHAYTDLGSSYLTRAQGANEREERLKYAKMSVDSLMKGLHKAPLNTFAWLRLATAQILRGPEHYNASLKAWRTSIETAPFEPFIIVQRVHLGIILYRIMASEDIDLLKEQLRMAHQWNRSRVRQYARQNNLLEWMAFLSEPGSEMAKYFSKQ